ncbi:hypothetical protein A3A35_02675 [Candidatus Kaiserbacteria bacterium RIFCSPLOWO2_01_FULL_51_21]|uniref:Peptidase S11 D-alanyl-D-alanine carboxypeptidase A N-terminal domain-containing protein n=1 Tax=Candidatus Kaiserbacteria bacterium RIFCSPLOWO2_01_FULL_51_21 TaxID=1798508 RepID=A0A1F6EDU0_9BACT|nr:MAG: hypothetical protein A3A35_02675 [Candidatus Kaiserbacteria bacterium RIFCSPLOWO2_01_FULL_51_21]
MKKNMREIHQQLLLGFFAMLSVGGAFLFALSMPRGETPRQEATVITSLPTPAPDLFKDLSLEAKAVIVIDWSRNQVLFEKNANAQLPLASLSKLMTVVVADEVLPKGSAVTIRPKDAKQSDNAPLRAGEQWRLKDLLDFTLIGSSNSGASALASEATAALHGETEEKNIQPSSVFLERMNQKAAELGLSQTYFLNETGLDQSSEVPGNNGSARDMAKLLGYIITSRPELLDATRYPEFSAVTVGNTRYRVQNTDTALGHIPGLIGSKTGLTDLAGGNLAVAFDAGIEHPIIVVILGSSQEGRFVDIQKLVDTSLSCLALGCRNSVSNL